MSHSDYEASFAMGKSQSATLVVDWRDGRRTTIPDVRPNREYEITTATARARVAADSVSTPTLFEDATSELQGHTHTENAFDDWDRQYLLPTALSQLGPGIAWFDLDRDGREDLIIGTGRGGRLGRSHNYTGLFVGQQTRGPVPPADYPAALGPADGRSLPLLAGVSTWEARPPAELTGQPAAIQLPVSRGTVSSIAKP